MYGKIEPSTIASLEDEEGRFVDARSALDGRGSSDQAGTGDDTALELLDMLIIGNELTGVFELRPRWFLEEIA